MTNRIRLDAQRHATFLAEQRKDPITKEPLRAGTEIVICANDKIAFIADNWPGECPICHNSNTLAYVPSNSLPSQLSRSHQRPTPTFIVERSIQTGNRNQENSPSWFSVSSHLAVNPMGFWGTLFTSATIAGVVTWIFRSASSSLPEFFFFTSLFSITPIAYLLIKNKLGIFLSLWGFITFMNWLSGYWDWKSIIVVSIMAIAGTWGFSGISGYRIPFIRTLVATSMSAGAFIGYLSIVDNAPPSDFSMYLTLAGGAFSASIISIIFAKIFGRG